MSNDVQLVQPDSLIRTELAIRGSGTTASPLWRPIQFWSLDGTLLAETNELGVLEIRNSDALLQALSGE
jgi:hypothetical protein